MTWPIYVREHPIFSGNSKGLFQKINHMHKKSVSFIYILNDRKMMTENN